MPALFENFMLPFTQAQTHTPNPNTKQTEDMAAKGINQVPICCGQESVLGVNAQVPGSLDHPRTHLWTVWWWSNCLAVIFILSMEYRDKSSWFEKLESLKISNFAVDKSNWEKHQSLWCFWQFDSNIRRKTFEFVNIKWVKEVFYWVQVSTKTRWYDTKR